MSASNAMVVVNVYQTVYRAAEAARTESIVATTVIGPVGAPGSGLGEHPEETSTDDTNAHAMILRMVRSLNKVIPR